MSAILLRRSLLSFRHCYHPALVMSSTQLQQQHPHVACFTTATGTNSAPAAAAAKASKPKAATSTSAAAASASSSSKVLRMDQLVKTVAETHELTQAESRRIIDTIVDTITDALSDNKKVALSSFGSFSTYTTKERHYRNPRTGADGLTPPKERVRFKAFGGLKKIVEHAK